jgi:opacity protein-like surface antigen
MKIALFRCTHAGLLLGALAGLLTCGAARVASAQFADWLRPASYSQPQASRADASRADGYGSFLQVAAYEPICSAPCAPPCGGCGQCGDCCEAGCDTGCDSCCDTGCDSGCKVGCCDPRLFYVALSGGWANREIVQEVGDPQTFLTFHNGFHINVAIGRTFDWVRLEAEISRFNQRVQLSGYEDPGVGNFVGRSPGNLNLTAYMFNAYHDFDIDGWRVDPYIGGGIGVCQSEINGLLPTYFQGPPLNLDDQAVNCTSNYQFAWQLRGGFNYDWSERTTLYCGYRYFQVQELTFSAFPFGTFNPNGGREHAIEWGLRVAF